MPIGYVSQTFTTGRGLIGKLSEGSGVCQLIPIEQINEIKNMLNIVECYFVEGLPSNSLGKNGDTCVDIETGNVYQKSDNSWFL